MAVQRLPLRIQHTIRKWLKREREPHRHAAPCASCSLTSFTAFGWRNEFNEWSKPWGRDERWERRVSERPQNLSGISPSPLRFATFLTHCTRLVDLHSALLRLGLTYLHYDRSARCLHPSLWHTFALCRMSHSPSLPLREQGTGLIGNAFNIEF